MNKFLVLLLIVIVSFSCNKDAELVDENLNNDLLEFEKVDNFDLVTYTVNDNIANGKNISNVLFGSVNDPRFGRTKASFYTQMSISQNAFDIGANPVLDSVVLILDQVSSFGSLNANFDIAVYELNQAIQTDEDYNNNTVLNVSAPPLASYNNFKLNSGTENVRIKLSNVFGTELLNQFGTSVMESSDNFKDFFKGLYITVASSAGDGIVNFNLKNDISKMVLYYSNDASSNNTYDYIVETADVTINQYTKDVSGSEAEQAVADGNTNETFSYATSMSNFRTALNFPDLSVYKENIINKAELTIYQADYGTSLSTTFTEPDQLFLFQNDNDTGLLFLPDFSLNNTALFGGAKELVTINGQNTNKYTFNITNYVQDLINGTAEFEQLFIATISNNEASRIKINGGAHPTAPIKLEILYTKRK